METWLAQITNYLLAQSWQIAILTIIVAIASFVLRNRSAHVRYLLWLIVLAKCLVPPLYSIPLAVLPQEQPQTVVPMSSTGERRIAENRTPEATMAESTRSTSVQFEAMSSPVVTERSVTFNILSLIHI